MICRAIPRIPNRTSLFKPAPASDQNVSDVKKYGDTFVAMRQKGGLVPAINNNQFLTIEDVIRVTSLGKTTIYKLIDQGLFPPPVSITGTRRVAWRSNDVFGWMDEQKVVMP